MPQEDPIQNSQSDPAPVSDSEISSGNPAELLKQAKAQEELNQMGFKSWADTIRQLEALYQAKVQDLQRVIDHHLAPVIQEIKEIRALMLSDLETQFAVTQVFQEQLVITEKIESDKRQIRAEVHEAKGITESEDRRM